MKKTNISCLVLISRKVKMCKLIVIISLLCFCPVFSNPQRLNGVRLSAENEKNVNNQEEVLQKVYKKCSTILMGSIEKVSTEYIWELRGFLDYMEYLNDFDPTFELNSEKVNFTTVPDLGGTWNFRIFKEQPIQAAALQKKPAIVVGNYTNGSGGTSTSNGTPNTQSYNTEPPIEMSVQAIHTWAEIVSENNAPEKRGINYKAILEIQYNRSLIFKEAKTTIPDTQFKFLNTGRYRQQYSYTFKWTNIHTILASLIQDEDISTNGGSMDVGAGLETATGTTPLTLMGNNGTTKDAAAGSSDIVFLFKMIAFLPNESKILSSSCEA